VTRSHITVRAADESDLGEVVVLWSELKHCGALTPRLAALADDRHIEDQVRRLIVQPRCRVLLASMSSQVVGMAMVSIVSLGALTEAHCLQVEYTVVKESFRRRGVGRALMAAAAAYAEEVGADQVTVSVSPLSREANRFFAQLGLAPLAVRRVAPAGALRRRIATLEHPGGAADHQISRRPVGARTGMRAALRRIAIASTVAEQPHDA
jgi:GNAT superfamily N-acetyltransferase